MYDITNCCIKVTLPYISYVTELRFVLEKSLFENDDDDVKDSIINTKSFKVPQMWSGPLLPRGKLNIIDGCIIKSTVF